MIIETNIEVSTFISDRGGKMKHIRAFFVAFVEWLLRLLLSRDEAKLVAKGGYRIHKDFPHDDILRVYGCQMRPFDSRERLRAALGFEWVASPVPKVVSPCG